MDTPEPSIPIVSPLELFLAFTRLTLYSFGGALFWSRLMLVEQRRWLTEHEFVELLALAQLLPGANGINLSVVVGYRFAGVRGAAASIAGFLIAPTLVIILIGALHQRFGATPLVHQMLSFLAVGGAPSILPEMHRYVVEVHAWMTSAQFAELYTLAQVAPGPNVMYIPLVGWHIAGWAGAVATGLPMIVPSCTLTLFVAHLYARHPKAAFGVAIRRGLTPITVGLLFASSWILMPAANEDWRGYVLMGLTVVLVLRTLLNPLWLLGAGAVAGMAGLV